MSPAYKLEFTALIVKVPPGSRVLVWETFVRFSTRERVPRELIFRVCILPFLRHRFTNTTQPALQLDRRRYISAWREYGLDQEGES